MKNLENVTAIAEARGAARQREFERPDWRRKERESKFSEPKGTFREKLAGETDVAH